MLRTSRSFTTRPIRKISRDSLQAMGFSTSVQLPPQSGSSNLPDRPPPGLVSNLLVQQQTDFREDSDMPYKQIFFRSDAREKVLRGAQRLPMPSESTLGPKSKCVLIGKKWGRPLVCNDGVTIAKEVELKDADENLGAQMMREAAERTGDVVGDGTTTSTIMAYAIWLKACGILRPEQAP